jgi:hypothetical protein
MIEDDEDIPLLVLLVGALRLDRSGRSEGASLGRHGEGKNGIRGTLVWQV